MGFEWAMALALVGDPMVRKGGTQIALVSGKAVLRGVERQTQEQWWGWIHPS